MTQKKINQNSLAAVAKSISLSPVSAHNTPSSIKKLLPDAPLHGLSGLIEYTEHLCDKVSPLSRLLADIKD
jgi:hypothetical protein